MNESKTMKLGSPEALAKEREAIWKELKEVNTRLNNLEARLGGLKDSLENLPNFVKEFKKVNERLDADAKLYQDLSQRFDDVEAAAMKHSIALAISDGFQNLSKVMAKTPIVSPKPSKPAQPPQRPPRQSSRRPPPATEKQLNYLRTLGCPEKEIRPDLNIFDASEMIEYWKERK